MIFARNFVLIDYRFGFFAKISNLTYKLLEPNLEWICEMDRIKELVWTKEYIDFVFLDQ